MRGSARSPGWARYSWPLDHELAGPTVDGFALRDGRKHDLESTLSVVLRAFASDPAWGVWMRTVEARMRMRIARTLGEPGARYLLVESGDRVVAVSGVARTHPTGQNLLTGPCVLPAYQRVGLGTWILRESLVAARAMALTEAVVYTRTGSVADERVYAKFGSRRTPMEQPPGGGEVALPPPENSASSFR